MNAVTRPGAVVTTIAPKTKAPKRAHATVPPSAKTVAARLAGLTPDAMPWLRADVDLTPADGGPEAFGPATYGPVHPDAKRPVGTVAKSAGKASSERSAKFRSKPSGPAEK